MRLEVGSKWEVRSSNKKLKVESCKFDIETLLEVGTMLEVGTKSDVGTKLEVR